MVDQTDDSNVDMRNRRRTRTQSGSLIIDTLVGLLIFALGAAAFFSLMPALQQGEKISKYESVATQISGRMIEHLQTLRPSEVTAENLTQMNLIDAGQTKSPFTFTDVPMDHATLYSPSQALPNGKAEMSIAPMDSKALFVVIEISWDAFAGKRQPVDSKAAPKQKRRTFTTGTVIGGYR